MIMSEIMRAASETTTSDDNMSDLDNQSSDWWDQEKDMRISTPELAHVIGYAEKPYVDLSRDGEKSSREIDTLFALAHHAGLAAATNYLENIKLDIKNYVGEDKLPELQPQDIEPLLNTSLTELYDDETHMLTRALNAVIRGGVKDVRQLLVIGKYGATDIRRLGKAGIDTLDEEIKRRSGNMLEWKNKPTLREIVDLCNDLGQVPACVALMGSWDERFSCSVNDILSSSTEELADMLVYHVYRSEDQQAIEKAVARWRKEAQDFADRFNALKQ